MFTLTWVVGTTLQTVASPSKTALATLHLCLSAQGFTARLWNKDKTLCY